MVWSLSNNERRVLERAMDALLPPEGSFPLPSETDLIDEFILKRVPSSSAGSVPYPGLDADMLKALLRALEEGPDMTAALHRMETERPVEFKALWALAVYGYYSRPETILAIQRDLASAYHGAPLPAGYRDAMKPWSAEDPLQMPRSPRGSFIPTGDVRRVDLGRLSREVVSE